MPGWLLPFALGLVVGWLALPMLLGATRRG